MFQNRPAPAYQEYASSMLADYNFRALNLAERGALYTLRLECWVNKRLPTDLGTLSKALGLPEEELIRFMPALEPFFEVEDGYLLSRELEDYRAYLEAVRAAKSKGGKKGAAITNAARTQVTRDSLVQDNKDQHSQAQYNSVTNRDDLDAWTNEYQDSELA